jgi:hypothetical protein
MPTVHLKVQLPFLEIGLDDIKITRARKQREIGPFVIIARACGLALDTAFATDMGAQPILYPPHGRVHQQWVLRSSGSKGEVAIFSVDNGQALDATVPNEGDIHPVLWESNNEPWQKWRLEPSADGLGFLIQSVHNRRYLTAAENSAPKWNPWFASRDGNFGQQWMLTMTHGSRRGVQV